MKRILFAVLTACLFAVADPPAKASTQPLRWWVLPADGGPRIGQVPDAAAYRTLKDAQTALGLKDGSVLDRVDFEKFMVLEFFPKTDHLPWTVLSCERTAETVTIRAMHSPTRVKACQAPPALLLVPRQDGSISIEWQEGDVEAAVAARDCSCGVETKGASAKGACASCGQNDDLGAGGLCVRCHEALQQCHDCGKRAASAAPLKKHK